MAPYGVYDLTANEGWVNVGISHDTAEFAVESVRRWWYRMGRPVYPEAKELLITADSGGSNGQPQSVVEGLPARSGGRDGIADRGLSLPAGDEQVEQDRAPDVLPHHRELARAPAGEPSGRGEPDREHADERRVCGSEAELDTNRYEKGIKVTDEEMESVRLKRDKFHGDWNYRIEPHPK